MTEEEGGFTMPSFGFVIDNRKCIGCHACTVACKSEHQVPDRRRSDLGEIHRKGHLSQ